MRRGCVLLGLSIAVGLTFAAMARQGHPPPGFPCKAFAKSEQGDWIPVRDVRLRGPGGSVEIKAGAAMLDELQEHLELRCHCPSRRLSAPQFPGPEAPNAVAADDRRGVE